MVERRVPIEIAATESVDALFDALRATDISVPPRTAGRRNWHRERWTIHRLIATLVKEGHLTLPFILRQAEQEHQSPDFVLNANARRIGIEVTDATSTQYEKFRTLAAQEAPDSFHEPAHFRHGTPAKTTDEMRQLLGQARLTSSGWSGDAPECEFALFVLDAIDRKLNQLRKAHFKKFDQNWLVVYDNAPLPALELSRAAGHLHTLLGDRLSQQPCFDTVFIEHGDKIVRVTNTGYELLPLNDLWSARHEN